MNKFKRKVAVTESCSVAGGPLAVTDANVVLGRIIPRYFPQIFGATEDQPLDVAASRCAFEELTNMVQGIHFAVFIIDFSNNSVTY